MLAALPLVWLWRLVFAGQVLYFIESNTRSATIIPGEARISGTVRTLDEELWEVIPGRIEKIIAGVSAAFGMHVQGGGEVSLGSLGSLGLTVRWTWANADLGDLVENADLGGLGIAMGYRYVF